MSASTTIEAGRNYMHRAFDKHAATSRRISSLLSFSFQTLKYGRDRRVQAKVYVHGLTNRHNIYE